MENGELGDTSRTCNSQSANMSMCDCGIKRPGSAGTRKSSEEQGHCTGTKHSGEARLPFVCASWRRHFGASSSDLGLWSVVTCWRMSQMLLVFLESEQGEKKMGPAQEAGAGRPGQVRCRQRRSTSSYRRRSHTECATTTQLAGIMYLRNLYLANGSSGLAVWISYNSWQKCTHLRPVCTCSAVHSGFISGCSLQATRRKGSIKTVLSRTPPTDF